MLSSSIVACADVNSGKIGDVYWEIVDNQLTIYGNGSIPGNQISGWIDFSDQVTTIVIEDKIVSIGENAFNGMFCVNEIYIPNTVTSIGYKAFANCTGLTDIELPYSVSDIDASFVDGCSALSSISVEQNNNEFCSENGVLYNKDKSVLIKYPSARADEEFTVPNSVHAAYGSAFSECVYLKSLNLPSTISIYGDYDFDENISVKIGSDDSEHLSHEYSTTVIPPTCFSEGYTQYVCSVCGYTETGFPTEKLNHVIEIDEAVVPTCKGSGLSQGSHCALCGTVFETQKTIDKVEHTIVNGICVKCGFREKISSAQETIVVPVDNATPTKLSRVKIKKTNPMHKGFRIYWNSVKGATKYQIQYSTSKSFKKKRSINVNSNNKSSKAVKKLKSNTTYYVRIRAVMNKSNQKVIGKWSKTYKVKTK